MADENLTQLSVTMPDTAATEPDVTPAVRRAAEVLARAMGSRRVPWDDQTAHATLAAALDVEEMAEAAYEYGRSTSPASTRRRMLPWCDLVESAREPYRARVRAIRAAIVGAS